jgi:hypothetical protein
VSYGLNMPMHCECGRVEEEAVMACIQVIYLYFHGSPEGNHKKHQVGQFCDWNLNQVPARYKSDVLSQS